MSEVQRLRERSSRSTGSATSIRLNNEIVHLEATIRTLSTDLEQIQERIDQRHDEALLEGPSATQTNRNLRMPNENQRDFLIRTGKITPFSRLPGRNITRSDSTLQGLLLDAEEEDHEETLVADELPVTENLSHRHLLQPGFVNEVDSDVGIELPDDLPIPKKRRRLHRKNSAEEREPESRQLRQKNANGAADKSSSGDEDVYIPDLDDRGIAALGESEDRSSDETEEAHVLDTTLSRRTVSKRSRKRHLESRKEDLTGLDDGNEKLYQNRLRSWVERRSIARANAVAREDSLIEEENNIANGLEQRQQDDVRGKERDDTAEEDEWNLPHPSLPDCVFEGGYRIPGDVYPSLFNYQKSGVKWLGQLYERKVGGILGDEMGLGKTIQVIAFLAGLHYSKKITKPILIVTPATVMKQWVNEFHTWWPPLRVSILHTSGSGMIDVDKESREEDLLSVTPLTYNQKPLTKAQKLAKRIVDRVAQEGHVLVTTYAGLQTHARFLVPLDWEYVVLDEGHKIRNPNASITQHCKMLLTANRIILSGTPMQNNLEELWSLFDFVFPSRLGTLVDFRQQFEIPIRQGGYANASNLQVQTAGKCAEILKDTISEYLLQRFKADVAPDLPRKSEQVLFCKLTRLQRDAYEAFLESDELKAIMNGKRQVLYGVDILRKICNHPDLQEHKLLSTKLGYDYGNGAKSGKMLVVKALLELWKIQGHKTLLFAQHRIMLDILEKFIRSLGGFNLRRMDGTTPIQARQGLVDDFNKNPDAHVFLLTTKVGGLGVNLTGADRVIIYDPDWNPSTDVQARERAWRLGQKREVKIYRLMTAGTIEEKIYQRQLFKQFLINKILKDPKQRQTFQMKDLHDLFTLGGANAPATETSELFRGTEVRFHKSETSSKPGPVDVGNGKKLPSGADADDSVRNLPGVASMERFRGDEEEERKAASSDALTSESRIMEGIFARSGVQAALEHDQIVNGKRTITADPKIIEMEARRVAAEAAKELRKAGEVARNVPVGIPTWTGQVGIAGRPEQHRGCGRGRGGPASSSILAGLNHRQGVGGQGVGAAADSLKVTTLGNSAPRPRGTDFMKMIRDYLVTHGGFVHTQMLIDHFNRYCDTDAKSQEFTAMLKELATLEKSSRGRGRWVLNEAYRSRA